MKRLSFSLLLFSIFVFSFINDGNAQSGTQYLGSWGKFGSDAGSLKFPAMIAVDKDHYVYVVDQHNHRVQKFDSAGNLVRLWGKLGSGKGEFNYPYGITLDRNGNIFVSDMNNHRVQKFSADGVFLASVGAYGTGNASFKFPYGIASDLNGNIYVVDAFNYRIQKFDNELKHLLSWGNAETIGIKLYMPHEIAVLPNNNIILSDRQNHRLSVFDQTGKLVSRFGDYDEGPNAKGGHFSEPHGIAVSQDGSLLVADRYNFRIQSVNKNFQFVSSWLTPGEQDDSKHFPLGVAVFNDVVYVTDHYSHQIQRYRIIK